MQLHTSDLRKHSPTGVLQPLQELMESTNSISVPYLLHKVRGGQGDSHISHGTHRTCSVQQDSSSGRWRGITADHAVGLCPTTHTCNIAWML